MKRLIIVVCTLLCILNVFAQEAADSTVRKDKIGFSVSLWGISSILGSFTLSGEQVSANHQIHTFGINYLHPLNKYFDFETGIEYSSFPPSGNLIAKPNSSSADQTTKNEDIYLINIPLTARLNFGKFLYLNGGLLLDIDISSKSSPNNSQSGIGTIIGIGSKYDFKSGWEITINPYTKLHSVIAFIPSVNTERLWETGFRIGVMIPLKY
jgi:hypothetical protein